MKNNVGSIAAKKYAIICSNSTADGSTYGSITVKKYAVICSELSLLSCNSYQLIVSIKKQYDLPNNLPIISNFLKEEFIFSNNFEKFQIFCKERT